MRNIIITGGELFNKGAQAMTFVAVDELRRRFPDHSIYLLSDMDLARPSKEREQYTFSFLGWHPVKFAHCQKNPFLRLLCWLRSPNELFEVESVYKNCDAMIDISGYALGSNWDAACCNVYLEHLEFAHGFGIPVYLMPQSFGPFDFASLHPGIEARCRKLLPEAKAILAREQDGYDALVNTFGLSNVSLAPDLVLNNKGIDLKNIYRTVPTYTLPEIQAGSVGLIPNRRTFSVQNEEHVLNLYESAVRHLIDSGRTVYLLHHAEDDISVCKELHRRFANSSKVILLTQEFNCVEFSELVRHFDFLIASRFHSIVHAYKNGIPCVVLGWAQKYQELLSLFDQAHYLFDVNKPVFESSLVSAIDHMIQHRQLEADKIQSHLTALQKTNVFDIIKL